MKNSTRWMAGLVVLAMIGYFLPSAPAQDIEAGPAKSLQIVGTIVKMDETSIVVKNEKIGERTFALDKGTRFGTKPDPKKASDFKEGASVLVFFCKVSGKFTAKAIVPRPI